MTTANPGSRRCSPLLGVADLLRGQAIEVIVAEGGGPSAELRDGGVPPGGIEGAVAGPDPEPLPSKSLFVADVL
jgi:hypothetical protein